MLSIQVEVTASLVETLTILFKDAKLAKEEGSRKKGYELHTRIVLRERGNREMPLQLIVMKGLASSGKSTLARALSKEYGWPLIDKDEVGAR